MTVWKPKWVSGSEGGGCGATGAALGGGCFEVVEYKEAARKIEAKIGLPGDIAVPVRLIKRAAIVGNIYCRQYLLLGKQTVGAIRNHCTLSSARQVTLPGSDSRSWQKHFFQPRCWRCSRQAGWRITTHHSPPVSRPRPPSLFSLPPPRLPRAEHHIIVHRVPTHFTTPPITTTNRNEGKKTTPASQHPSFIRCDYSALL